MTAVRQLRQELTELGSNKDRVQKAIRQVGQGLRHSGQKPIRHSGQEPTSFETGKYRVLRVVFTSSETGTPLQVVGITGEFGV